MYKNLQHGTLSTKSSIELDHDHHDHHDYHANYNVIHHHHHDHHIEPLQKHRASSAPGYWNINHIFKEKSNNFSMPAYWVGKRWFGWGRNQSPRCIPGWGSDENISLTALIEQMYKHYVNQCNISCQYLMFSPDGDM